MLLTRKSNYLIVMSLLIPLGLIFSSQSVSGIPASPQASGRVSWTPEVPGIGETITITYNTSDSNALINTSSPVYLIWGMYVPGNQLFTGKDYGAVAPSMEMWPENSTLVPFNVVSYIAVKSPMTQNSDLWEISFELNGLPDYLVFYFVNEIPIKDDNGKNYWFIHTKLEFSRIRVQSPTMNIPSIVLPDSTVTTKVEASENATNWGINLQGAGNTLSITPSSSYDSENKIWELSFPVPSELGLYDLIVHAEVDGTSTSHTETRSIKIIAEFKEEYTFVLLGDPQFHRDGSAGYVYRNERTGIGNFTDLLQEINILNPEFVLVMGDLTEWTDEVALNKYPEWLSLYLDSVPFVSIIGNHGDFEATATTPTAWEWGSGKGVWNEIIGPTHGTFWYGDHAFVLGDSSGRNYDSLPEEMNYLENSMETARTSASMKTLSLHHPLTNYGSLTEMIQGDTERNQILTWLRLKKFEAFFHGHLHVNKYDEINNVKHIGTTESVGDNPGYRVVSVRNDEIIDFSYGNADASTYSAPSWPINRLNVSYSNLNDGSETTATATIQNGLNHSLINAHVRFKMDPSNEYSAIGGHVLNSYIKNGIKIVDVLMNVSATSSNSVNLEVYFPTTTTTKTDDIITTTEKATAVPLSLIFSVLIIAVIYRKRK